MKTYTAEELKEILELHTKWWTKWKPVIMNIIEISPAEPTGYKDV